MAVDKTVTDFEAALSQQQDHIGNIEQELKSDVNKLNSRLGGVEQAVAGMVALQKTQAEDIKTLVDRVNQPKDKTDIAAWVGVGIMMLVTAGSIGALSLSPIQHQLDSVDAFMLSHNKESVEAAYNRGKFDQYALDTRAQHLHLDEQHHVTQARLSDLEKKAAAGGVSRQATGDYAKELGTKVDQLRTLP